MTVLNWILADDGLAIVSDTLSLDASDNRPMGLVTKVFYASHLELFVAGTGIARAVTGFYYRTINSVVRDITHLNEFAPTIASSIWDELQPRLPDGATATVYTFGWSPTDQAFVGFAYRSTSDFASEKMPKACGVKPQPDNLDMTQPLEGVQDLAEMAYLQQQQDRVRPKAECVGIGGHLVLHKMQRLDEGSIVTTIARLAQMPHFDDDWEIILAKLPENAGHPLSEVLFSEDE